MPWFCINTHPGKERLAEANITRQNFEVFLPKFLRTYPKAKERLCPLFPGYLFVQFDPDNDIWYPLCHTLGVKRLFSINPPMNNKAKSWEYIRPLPVSTELVESLREQAKHGFEKQAPVADVIEAGTRVKVISGTFDGKEGICSWSSSKRVSLLLEVMNGTVEVSFSRDSVELVRSCQPQP